MDLTGTRLSHYRIVSKLGEGGMGAVYRAEDVRLGRHVALKLLPPASAADPKVRERFLAEARAVSALDHPHICLLYEFNEEEGVPFIAMQLVDGETLKQEVSRGPLEEARAREVLGAIAGALEAAHSRGIIHRDVKSDNILLGRDGAIKLADFGIARLIEAAGLTATSTLVGTATYLAPEQFRGEAIGPAADQFSLGVVAYECLTGELPFGGENLASIMYAVLNLEPDAPSRRRAGLSPFWDVLAARALSKDPAARYASMGEFRQALAGGEAAVATQAAAARTGVPAAAAPLYPRSATPSVAVLYFENLSGDPDGDYFCAGITEDILVDLSKVPGLVVASRNAVARYRGQRVDVARVAAELGVGAVVEGSVRRAGNRVRITAQLVDPSNGFQLWADRYDRTLEDVFAVQEDIAHSIATSLRGALSPAEAAEIMRGRPAEVEAYDLYLKGRELYRRYTYEDNLRALVCFEEAAHVDPGYALAWAGVADCCAQMHDKAWDTDPAWQERGFEAARRSIELDPRLAEGHKAEALLWRTRRDHERAVESLNRALTANPRFLPAIMNLAQEHLTEGDFAAAERTLRRAVAVDPAYGFSYLLLATLFLWTRRYDQAIETSHRAQSTGGSPFYATYAYALRAHALAEEGHFDAAERELAGGRAAGVGAPILIAAEALVRGLSGHPEKARALLGELLTRTPAESYGCELAASAAAALGDPALAARFLRAAERIDQRHWASWRIRTDLKPVRETPEFAACIGDRGRRLVWPREAPALSAEDRAQFVEYAEATGVPEEDEVHPSAT